MFDLRIARSPYVLMLLCALIIICTDLPTLSLFLAAVNDLESALLNIASAILFQSSIEALARVIQWQRPLGRPVLRSRLLKLSLFGLRGFPVVLIVAMNLYMSSGYCHYLLPFSFISISAVACLQGSLGGFAGDVFIGLFNTALWDITRYIASVFLVPEGCRRMSLFLLATPCSRVGSTWRLYLIALWCLFVATVVEHSRVSLYHRY